MFWKFIGYNITGKSLNTMSFKDGATHALNYLQLEFNDGFLQILKDNFEKNSNMLNLVPLIGVNFKEICFVVQCIIAIMIAFRFIKYSSKKKENRKEINMDQLRAIFDAAAVGVISTDNCNMVTYMNITAADMCSWKPEDAVGHPFADVIRLTQPRRESEILKSKQYKGYPTFILHSKDKRYLHVQKLISPLIVQKQIIGSVILLKDVSQSYKFLKRLVYNASYDHLTGLPNRASFEKYLQETINKSKENGSKHALVYLDLDGFKAVNDSAGHLAGDALLKELSQLMRGQLRASDFLARIGGDEFAMVIFDCELNLAKCLIEILLSKMEQHKFHWNGETYQIGASAGVVTVGGDVTADEAMTRADAGCYRAKRCGKGQVCLYE